MRTNEDFVTMWFVPFNKSMLIQFVIGFLPLLYNILVSRWAKSGQQRKYFSIFGS